MQVAVTRSLAVTPGMIVVIDIFVYTVVLFLLGFQITLFKLFFWRITLYTKNPVFKFIIVYVVY
jgi:hypothetical protein